MKNKVNHINFSFEEYASANDLTGDEKELLEKAKEASAKAYAPYSQFYVGAALQFEDGTIMTGNNQENVAYPSGLCAERVAFFAAGAQFPGKKIKKVAVIATSENFRVEEPVAPCGACRQAMSEYEIKQEEPIRLLMAGMGGKVYAVNGITSLLPLVFNETKLRKD